MGPAAATEPSKEDQVRRYLQLSKPKVLVFVKEELIKSPSNPELIKYRALTALLPTQSMRVNTSQDIFESNETK